MTILIDIGSTIVKVAFDPDNNMPSQEFHHRDYDVDIYDQISSLVGDYRSRYPNSRFRICSSANGGLRTGIVCLTERFSGSVARNLALSAGANIIFVETLGNTEENWPPRVDTLVVVGGIDCRDVQHMRTRLAALDVSRYRFQTLLYAGNRYLAEEFQRRYPAVIFVQNPLRDDLDRHYEDLLYKIRDLYLDDLIGKEGVARLQAFSEVPIWPTPAIVNLAYEQIIENKLKLRFPAPCIVFDVGGATTDMHFGLEVVERDGSGRLSAYRSCNRHVFTELGVFYSRKSTINRLSVNERLYEFLRVIYGPKASRAYADFREGNIDEELPFYACFFLALDSVARGDGTNVPRLNVEKINSIVVTGGASQQVNPDVLSQITTLFLPQRYEKGIKVFLDVKYEIWVEGMKHFPEESYRITGDSGE